MESHNNDDQVFEKLISKVSILKGREFNNCLFKKCDFTDAVFSFNKFLDCRFEDCNLSMIKLKDASVNNVSFFSCKMLGIDFSECQEFLFSVYFDSCILDYTSFMGKKMLKTNFIKGTLKEANFSMANLSGSVFQETDLSGTIFNRTDLGGVNFLTAKNYSLDPEINNIKKAKFSLDGLPGLLEKYLLVIE